MESLEQLALHASNIMQGVASTALAIAHRGSYEYNDKRAISVSIGNGISSKLIRHVPDYRKISAGVDHLIASYGFTVGVGGVLGTAEIFLDKIGLLEIKSVEFYPYALSAALYFIFSAADSFVFFKRKLDKGDILQSVADVTGLSIALIWTYNSFK